MQLDVYNLAEYSPVPWQPGNLGGREVRVGTPLLVAYLRLVEAWIVEGLGLRGVVAEGRAAELRQAALRDARALVSLALRGEPALQLPCCPERMYGRQVDEEREARRRQGGEFFMPAAERAERPAERA